jgi:hypothetical protein
MIVVNIKEIMVHTHGHTTVWRIHIGVGRSGHVTGWYQQLRDWWMTHTTARREARVALMLCRRASGIPRHTYLPGPTQPDLDEHVVQNS